MEFDAAFIGRFQPFHNGHLNAVKGILAKHKNLLIIIGSSQESKTEKNPYDYELRERMIIETLNSLKVDLARVSIVPLPDIKDDTKWVSYLIESVPSFECMYTGSLDTKSLFEKYSEIPIKKVDFVDGLSGTLVREKLALKQDILELVPEPVLKLIQVK